MLRAIMPMPNPTPPAPPPKAAEPDAKSFGKTLDHATATTRAQDSAKTKAKSRTDETESVETQGADADQEPTETQDLEKPESVQEADEPSHPDKQEEQTPQPSVGDAPSVGIVAQQPVADVTPPAVVGEAPVDQDQIESAVATVLPKGDSSQTPPQATPPQATPALDATSGDASVQLAQEGEAAAGGPKAQPPSATKKPLPQPAALPAARSGENVPSDQAAVTVHLTTPAGEEKGSAIVEANGDRDNKGASAAGQAHEGKQDLAGPPPVQLMPVSTDEPRLIPGMAVDGGSATIARSSADNGADLGAMRAAIDDPQQAIANTGKVVRGLYAAVNHGGGSLTLRLSPPEMGVVRIELQMQQGVVRAGILTQHEAARELLSQQLGQLRHALERHGLVVDRLQVETMPSTQEKQAADAQHQGQDGRSRGQHHGQPRGDGRSAGDDRQEARRSFNAELLDMLA